MLQVAERVADERCESLGQSVGYQIRLEQSVALLFLFNYFFVTDPESYFILSILPILLKNKNICSMLQRIFL